MWKFFLLTFLGISISQCKSVDYATPAEFIGPKFSFGNGGGFAGSYKEYLLCENGQLFFRTNAKSGYQELTKLDKSKVKQTFKNYELLQIGKMNIDDPGNLYYFLIQSSDDKIHKLQWGGMNIKAPENLKVFYRNLMNMVKNKHPVK
jgi:hypothetical protein